MDVGCSCFKTEASSGHRMVAARSRRRCRAARRCRRAVASARLVLPVLLLGAAVSGHCQQAYEEAAWPKPARTAVGSPSCWHWGEVVGIAATAGGNMLLLHRGAQPIMEFDPAGNFRRAWGDGLISEGKVTLVAPEHRAPGASGYAAVFGPAGCHSCGAHSIRVDPQGYLWVVDAAGHIVSKMDEDGGVLMQLGEKGVSGMDRARFNLPTDVAFAPGGEIYVSDGYGNARIVKFSGDGDYLLEWGSRGTGPGEFGLPSQPGDRCPGAGICDGPG